MNKKLIYILAGILGLSAVAFAAINSGFPYAVAQWPGFGPKRGIVQFAITGTSNTSSANFVPGVTNTNALGTSSLRFSNVYTTALDISGTATLTGLFTQRSNAAPRTNVTPTAAYQIIINTGSSPAQACISTGTLISQWALLSNFSTACSN